MFHHPARVAFMCASFQFDSYLFVGFAALFEGVIIYFQVMLLSGSGRLSSPALCCHQHLVQLLALS